MLSSVRQILQKGGFVRNVLTLMTGTIIAQAIPIAISPILTRIYSPEDFGVFALYMSIVSILGVIATGRYELAIMLPVNDKEAENIVVLSISITVLFSLLCLIGVTLFQSNLVTMLGSPEITNWLYLIPFSILLTGVYQTLNYWSNRKKRYKRIMSNRIIQSTSTAGLNIGMGTIGYGTSGLILSSFFGQLITTFRFILKILKHREIKREHITRNNIKSQAKKYSNFPKYSIVAHGTETVSGNLPIILLTTFFGTKVVGFYSLARRVIILPISVIAGSIGDVFLQRASTQFSREGSCLGLYKKTFFILTAIAIIPFTILFIIAPSLFSFVFGEQWREAGIYTQYLTIPFFLQFIASPLSNMFIVAERQRLELLLQIPVIFLTLLAIMSGYYFFESEKIAIIFFSLALSLKYIIFLVLCYFFAKGLKYSKDTDEFRRESVE